MSNEKQFTEGGRGKKECICGIFVGVRTTICPKCSHAFKLIGEKASEKLIKVSSKTPISESTVVQSSVSDHKFTVNNDQPSALATLPAPKELPAGNGEQKIQIPAGPCPFKPEGYKIGWPDGLPETKVVEEWADKVFNTLGNAFSVEAVVYYVRKFWDVNQEKDAYRQTCGLVRRHLS